MFRLFVLGPVFSLFCVCLLFTGCGGRTAAPRPSGGGNWVQVQHWSDRSGLKTGMISAESPRFTTAGPWRITWAAALTGEKAGFAIDVFDVLHKDADGEIDELATGNLLYGSTTPQQGETEELRAGKFHLRIDAFHCHWDIVVWERR